MDFKLNPKVGKSVGLARASAIAASKEIKKMEKAYLELCEKSKVIDKAFKEKLRKLKGKK